MGTGCGKKENAVDAGAPTGSVSEGQELPDAAPMSEREAAQWEAAKEGEDAELMRLVDLVGCEGLEQRAGTKELRATALAAMAYCPEFTELPWLARVGMEGNDADARAALEAVVEQAARPRRSTDPEDAEELHAGCQTLLALAKDASRPKERRVLAVNALRMVSERGCVKAGEIPTELDAK
jgi:hypothetical protein